MGSYLMPKKTKHRKYQRGSLSGLSKGGSFVEFGDFGIQALGRGWLNGKAIEACRVAITRSCTQSGEKNAKIWIKIFPDHSVSKKPAEVRMGSGKGAPSHWVARIKPGRVLFEVGNVTQAQAQEACRLAAAKLSIPTRFVKRLAEKV